MSSQGNLRRLRKDTDYISKLPDTILCFILSFLSTKYVMRTSILSKRWKYLWTKVPALDFANYYDWWDMEMQLPIYYSSLSLEQKMCFKSFVERVLFHNNVSYVQRFCLHLHNADEFFTDSWLTAASRREIHEINISLHWTSELRILLPSRLISREKLVVLKLKGHIILSDLNISQLPNLETVHLEKLKFPDHGVLTRLCSCPVLKELQVDRCDGLPKVLYVVSLTLESLTLIQEIDGMVSSCFVIKTPNINYVRLSGKLSQYDIGDMCSLIEAQLDVAYDDDDNDGNRAQKLLGKVSGVKTLKLGDDVFVDERKLPSFQNLTYLHQDADKVMCELLKCAPKLKSLVIGGFNYEIPFEPVLAPEHLPCLETIEVCCLQGDVEEYDMIAYFLKAASGLKEMKIKTLLNCSESRIAAYERLLSMPRSSSICQVHVASFLKFARN